MPRRKPEFYETQEVVYTVDVSLSEDHLNASGRLVGKVKSKTVNIRNILADIKDKGDCRLDDNTLFYAAREIALAYMERLRRGYALDLLGLGRLYPALDGTYKTVHDAPSLRPNVVPRFTPSKDCVTLCEKLQCRFATKSNSAPTISCVRSFDDKRTADAKTVVYAGQPMELRGRNLKLEGDGAGVYFTPRGSERAICVPPQKVANNFPKSLLFCLPKEIPSGLCAVEVRTHWSRSGRLKKELCRGNSVEILVER